MNLNRTEVNRSWIHGVVELNPNRTVQLPRHALKNVSAFREKGTTGVVCSAVGADFQRGTRAATAEKGGSNEGKEGE